ncbi:unnamed protein product [Diamesa tonsa]
MPCNLTSQIEGDRVALVIWYKEGQTTPIYSYDARDSNALDGGSHHGGNQSGKYYFNTSLNPATFTVTHLQSEDEGIYRCRVDFLRSPTKNSKIQLVVIIPPENLLILDDKGKHIPNYILGPYNEGTSINLTCISSGGRPLPKLTWWRDNVLLTGLQMKLSDKRIRNVLYLKNLGRKDLLASYICQSSNNNITEPIASSVMIDLNLRPLSVKIVQDLKFMSTRQTYDLKCEVRGSRPEPTITWWLGSTQMTTTKESPSKDGNLTVSVMTYHPQIEDQGKFLSCRAVQALIPESGTEKGFKLNLHHPPLVKLEFGTNPVTEGNSINEGADVYFECNIKANPWVYRVAWKHNDYELQHLPLEGVIISNQSLVLQNVTRVRMGQYTCVASNSEGDGESKPYPLDVQFSPVCRPGVSQVYGVDRGEIAEIKCEVESNPAATDFKWKFNTSIYDLMDLSVNEETKNIMVYKPTSESDYGTILCWGINLLGQQSDPCVFTVLPAGKPDQLTNCSIINQTQYSIEVTCVEGFDYGYPQSFIAELYNSKEKIVFKSISSRTPFFDLKGLFPGHEFNVVLTAVNKRGRSQPTIIQAYTLKIPEKHTDLTYSVQMLQRREILMILFGGVLGILLIAVVIAVVAKFRGSRGLDSKPATIPLPPLPIDQMDQQQMESCLDADKNPDIIPHQTLEEWHEATNLQQLYGTLQKNPLHHQQYRVPPLQHQSSYHNSTSGNGGLIIYSGATLGRPPKMNNNFKRFDSNGICAQQIDLTSPPLPPHNQYHHLQQHHQQQQQHQQQQSLMVASCQGNFQNTPTTNLNTLDRYPPPPSPLSPTMFISSSSNPPGPNEPRSILKPVPEIPYYHHQQQHPSITSHETTPF